MSAIPEHLKPYFAESFEACKYAVARLVLAHPSVSFPVARGKSTVSLAIAGASMLLAGKFILDGRGAHLKGDFTRRKVITSLGSHGAMVSKISDLLVVGGCESVERVLSLFDKPGVERFVAGIVGTGEDTIFDIYERTWTNFFSVENGDLWAEAKLMHAVYRAGEVW